jgi:hypothetical protein
VLRSSASLAKLVAVVVTVRSGAKLALPLFSFALAAFLPTVTATAAARGAAAPRQKTIASYCSPSGDVCLGIVNRSGAVHLELSTAARYFDRYRLCVRPPGGGAVGPLRCGSFPVLRRGPGWGSSVKYARQYPVVGPGTYRVSWRLGAKPLGPTLRFRLPLAG